MPVTSPVGQRYDVAHVERFAVDVLSAADAPDDVACVTARGVVQAELWGRMGHGLARLPQIIRRIRGGAVDPAARPRLVREGPAVRLYDGQRGIGQFQVHVAAIAAAELAASTGVAAVAVVNGTHCGAAALAVLPVVERGAVGMAFTNGPAALPAWGGRTPVVGTNPVVVGAPRRGRPPVLVDVSPCVVPRGRLLTSLERGESIPEGWALGPDGEPTTDPAQGLLGSVLPIGGAKGVALALAVELLAGALTGAALGPDITDPFGDPTRPQGLGHLIVALDPQWFGGAQLLDDRIEQLSTYAGDSGAEGNNTALPGDGAANRAALAQRDGLPLAAGTVSSLHEVARRYGVDPPEPYRMEANT